MFSLLHLLKLIRANIIMLVLVPVIMGVTVFVLTKDSPKTYVTKSKVYTGIASGYSIESQQNSSFNFFAINNAFDNLIDLIKSRSTLEQTALKLYALHLVQDDPQLPIITYSSINELKLQTPEEVKKLVDKSSVENTYRNLLDLKNHDESNFVYKLINLNHPHYSYNAVSKIRVKRVANSDMVEISFESDDPAVCFQTVKLLMETFIVNYSTLKANQTDAVVKYFQAQLDVAHKKLQYTENKLLNFNMDNRIINYYEQSKHVASEKEKFQLERQAVMLDFAAAESVIKNLENNLGAKAKLQLQGRHIIKMRNDLNELNEKIAIARYQIANDTVSNNNDLNKWENETAIIKSKLKTAVDSLHYYENTKQGIQIENIIYNWLQNVIAYEEANAKITALKIRSIEIDSTIRHYAPLGANLKKIEREIDVVEREYLSLLHSLSLAKLKQQNLELSSNIKVVDPPILPISPLPSKTKLMIIAAGLAGFVMSLAFIILIKFFDTTLQSLSRCEKITGLRPIGDYPFFNPKKTDNHLISELKRRAVNAISNNLLNVCKKNGLNSFKIGFISNYDGEGKSTIADTIADNLKNDGHEVTLATNGCKANAATKISETNEVINFSICEFPGLMNRILPHQLYSKYNFICMVIRSDRGWGKADQNMLEMVKSFTKADIGFILNAVKPEEMGDFTGQLPKKRSKARRLIKRFVMFRFFEKFETS